MLLRKDVYPYEYMDRWDKFNEKLIPIDVDYPSKLHKLHSDMPFLPERMKIDKI